MPSVEPDRQDAAPGGSLLLVARRHSRRLVAVALAAFSAIVLLPNWIVLPNDDEGLFVVINPTLFQAHHLFTTYEFWNPFIEFGGTTPGSQSLIFHPFLLLAGFAPLAFSIGLLYQVQFLIALLALWAVCRHFGMNRWVAAVCAATFALCSVTIQLLFVDFWPEFMTAWTLSPLLLLLVVKLLESEERKRGAFYGVAAGLCGALMILDGHTGLFPTYGIAFAAFLLGSLRDLRRVWPWVGLAVLVLAAAVSTRVYDIALENSRGTNPHSQQVYPFDFQHFFFYPHYDGSKGPRQVAYGLPFVVLVLLGLLWPRLSGRFLWGIRLAVVASFLGWLMPVGWIPALSGNYHFAHPLTLFSICLAGLALQGLWQRFPSVRWGLLAVIGLQVAVLVWGFYGFYRPNLDRAVDYLHGRPVPTLKKTFDEQDIYRYFERQHDHSSTRVLMSFAARDRLWRTLTDYTWPAWGWRGLRLVNGHIRGADASEFQETKEALHGEIRGEPNLWEDEPDDLQRAKTVLDVLDIGYVLAVSGEKVAEGLVPIRTFRLVNPPALIDKGLPKVSTIIAYRNPGHWADAVVVEPRAKQLDTFKPRPGCGIPGLLCDDLTPILALGQPGVSAVRWRGTTLDVRLTRATRPRVLMVSQLYRPGWRATLSNGRTIDGYRLFGGVTGFDLPAGVTSARITFHPTARIAFAGLSWATVLLSAVFLVVTALLGWYRARPG